MSAATGIRNLSSVCASPERTELDNDHLETICALGAQISSAHNLDDLLHGYLHELVRGTATHGAAVRLYDRQANLRLVEAYGLDPGFVDLERRRPASQCACEAAASQQQVRCHNNLHYCTRKMGRTPVTNQPCLAMLAVPIYQGHRTLGLFNLYFERQLLAKWPSLPQVMVRLGEQLGGAINRIQQQQQEQQSSIQQERMLLAHELHDTIVQEISALRLYAHQLELNTTGGEPDIAKLNEQIQQVSRRIESTHEQVREVMHQFHSQALGTELDTALTRLVNRFRRDSQINIRLINHWPAQALEERQELHIHRLVEESLSNAWHHGDARNVLIMLTLEGDELHLLIEDDGRGFSATALQETDTEPTPTSPPRAAQQEVSPPQRLKGYGLPGMRERARQLGALLHIDSEPEQGTQVHLQLPVAQLSDWLNQGPSRVEDSFNARTPC